ncbi:MAG: helix-hairpin-helix domain-containing protein [Deltaproteobacteria bacterium]|nr:helix-hairpin-helix domain-containing protein [Deltaproteobacteria bacterium]
MRRLVFLFSLASGVAAPACQQGTPPPTQAVRIDLNTATLKDLERLPAVGDKLARKIMASRNARGGRFDNLEQLLQIDGVGAKTLDAIRPYVYVR